MKSETVRVHAPTSVVFLCGGAMDATLASPAVLRDAFFRVAATTGVHYKIVLAEDAKPLEDDAGYRDLLSFESDIAQLVALILLFAESAGSLAELGAFAALKTVAPNLLAVLDDYYYGQVSFIRDGPVRHLEKKYGEETVFVIDRADVGIAPDGSIAALDLIKFGSGILPAVADRIESKPKWERFDASNSGHAILLLVGLCREFGALTKTEIKDHLTAFGVQEVRFDNFVYCARLLGWIEVVRKGHHIYYVFSAADAAIDFILSDDAPYKDKLRWRSAIRAFWKANDSPRFNAITDVALKGAAA